MSGAQLLANGAMSNVGVVTLKDVTAPANPGSGLGSLYKKTTNNGIFWKPDAAGPETNLVSGGFNGVEVLTAVSDDPGPAVPVNINSTASITYILLTGNFNSTATGTLFNGTYDGQTKKIIIYQPASTAVQMVFNLDTSTSTDVYMGNTIIVGIGGIAFNESMELIWSAAANRWYIAFTSFSDFFAASDV